MNTNKNQIGQLMAFRLVEKVISLLKENPEQRYIARDIAAWILETYPDECRDKQRRSKATIPLDSDTALIQQIASEIGAKRSTFQKNYPTIKTTGDRPRKYYYTAFSDSDEIDQAEGTSASTAETDKLKEHDLYPRLTTFLWSELGIYSKRIDEKRSSNTHGKRGNKWLYPDLVGMENLSQGWAQGIKDCVKEYADKKTKLWSFEVKILINRSNVRETFFQTVSNSSWANFGYLVASEIGSNTLKELQILSSLHGIGFIKLNDDNPSESQIIIPAKEKSYIDWDTANRLVSENQDFLDYIKQVRHFYQTGDVIKSAWDKTENSRQLTLTQYGSV